MSVYVGKDVSIVIQSPVEEDVSSQANGTNMIFTVSRTPISDRDQDGVANEPEHVTLYRNGLNQSFLISAVDDATGQVTLSSAPSQGDRIILEYRHDSSPEIAQEVTIEPRQTIEGIDGLGNNKIQAWAQLLKEFSGSLKEVFRTTSQFNRFAMKRFLSKYSQQFWTSAALNDFQGETANFTVDEVNHELYVNTNETSRLGVKDSVVPMFRDGVIKCKMKKLSSGDGGWVFRWDGTYNNYYRAYLTGTKRLRIDRIKNGNTVNLLETEVLTLPSSFFPVEVRFAGTKIVVDVSGSIFSLTDSDPLVISGMSGFYAYYALNERFDDFQLWGEGAIDEHGLILTYNRGGSIVKIALDGVIFPGESVPTPKSAPVFITSSFRARKIKFIT